MTTTSKPDPTVRKPGEKVESRLSPQSTAPGEGIAPPPAPREGLAREAIESPVQAMRDPREEQETTHVNSGGDKLKKRGGEPASIEEKRAAGDKIPPGDHPFAPGVPGVHGPGTYTKGPEKAPEKVEAKKEK